MIQLIEFFELERKAVAHRVFNAVTDISSPLKGGITNVSFHSKTDSLLSNGFSNQGTAKAIKHFMEAFRLAGKKFEKHVHSQKESLDVSKVFGYLILDSYHH